MTAQKLTSSYGFPNGSSTVLWRSKCQSIVALSLTEAEYVALSNATQKMILLRSLLNDMGFDQGKPTTIFEGNQGTIELTKNPSHHSRTKHIDIKFHHVHDTVATKKIYLHHCLTQEMTADLLTKGL